MAVYKSIYCYPFSENADLASVFPAYTSNGMLVDGEPFYFSCRVESSNKDVIGYSIRIYDDAGKVVFPVDGGDSKVSPISELPKFPDDPTINSGVNGTYLKIPFFQEYSKVPDTGDAGSYNALYCMGPRGRDLRVDLVMCDSIPDKISGTKIKMSGWDNSFESWDLDGDVLSPRGDWDGKINGVQVTSEHVVLVAQYYRQSGIYYSWYLFRLNVEDEGKSLIKMAGPQSNWSERDHVMSISRGYYSGVYACLTDHRDLENLGELRDGGLWHSATQLAPITQFAMNGSSYNWEITLYQGPKEDSTPGLLTFDENDPTVVEEFSKFATLRRLDISKMPGTWFDVTLGTGKVLGSNKSRLQLSDFGERNLPGEDMSDFSGLLNRYATIVTFANIGYQNSEYEEYYEGATPWENGMTAYYGRYYKYLGDLWECRVESTTTTPSRSSGDWSNIESIDSLSIGYPSSSPFSNFSIKDRLGYRILDSRYSFTLDYGWGTYSGGLLGSFPIHSFDRSLGHVYLGSEVTFSDEEFSRFPRWNTYTFPPSNSHTGPEGFKGKYLDGVVFYPHSSNPEDLYNRDTVETVISNDVDFSSPYPGLRDKTVLLRGQNDPAENGIYKYVSDPGEGGDYFQRSGAYTSWASYIGRVILDKSTNINYSNTAEAGGTIDQSPLYFFEELPLEIFNIDNFTNYGELRFVHVEDGHLDEGYFDYFYGLTAKDVDENALSNGLYLAYSFVSDVSPSTGIPYHRFGCVSMKVEGGKWVRLPDQVDYNESYEYYCKPEERYAQLFEHQGKQRLSLPIRLWQDTVTGSIDEDRLISRLSQILPAFMGNRVAKILRNSPERTFVSPNKSLAVYDRLRFEGDAYTVSLGKKITAIEVKGLNSKFWWIEHSNPPISDDTETVEDKYERYKWVLKSYNADDGSPFSYTIRSCFMTGNECAFTDFAIPSIAIEGEEMGLVETGSYKWHAVGRYYQGQARSWETYRFILWDSENNALQDTGERYGGELDTWFVGIDPDYTYYVTLVVTDDLGYRLTIRDEVEFGGSSPERHWEGATFVATPDCPTHSIRLEFGIDALPEEENGTVSIFRREASLFERPDCNGGVERTSWFASGWYPIAIEAPVPEDGVVSLRDFNVANGHTYQYAIFPKNPEYCKLICQQQGSEQEPEQESEQESEQEPGFVRAGWDEWSITELELDDSPISLDGSKADVPAIKRRYKVDPEKIWLLKFGSEMGSVEQNLARGETQTLGRYDRIGYSKRNFASGSASCYLGSEIAPLKRGGYIERVREAYTSPTGTNEAQAMLAAWKDFVHSPKPKLLTDRKGGKWIVQITSSNTTPQESYLGLPSKISFSWKEIEKCDDGVIIYGDGKEITAPGEKPEWKPVLKYNN